jgi:GAF domain-containing protein
MLSELSEVVAAICQSAAMLSGASATSLLLIDKEKHELVRMATARDATAGSCDVPANMRFPFEGDGAGMTAACCASGSVVQHWHAESVRSFRAVIDRIDPAEPVESFLGVPLRNAASFATVAVIQMVNYNGGAAPFPPEVTHITSQFAQYASHALHRAMHAIQVERQFKELDERYAKAVRMITSLQSLNPTLTTASLLLKVGEGALFHFNTERVVVWLLDRSKAMPDGSRGAFIANVVTKGHLKRNKRILPLNQRSHVEQVPRCNL